MTGPLSALTVGLSALIATTCAASAQTVTLPTQVTAGQPVIWHAEGLSANKRVDAVILRRYGGQEYRSAATFEIGADGKLDPSRMSAISGSYSGIDAAGLFWSMKSIGASPGPDIITVSLMMDGLPVATKSATLINPSFTEIAVGQFPGARLFTPKMAKGPPPPVIIVLGGSEGGDSYGRLIGSRLAAEGFAALALPYYNSGWGGKAIPGLPNAFRDIPIDRLESVQRWLALREDIDGKRIAVLGASKGAEFALVAATKFRWISAIGAIVPTDVVWEGWGDGSAEGTTSSFAWRGKPLPFVPYFGMKDVLTGYTVGRYETFLRPHVEGRRKDPRAVAKARIPVEQITVPLFVAGGDRDTTWPSGQMARNIAERRAEHDLSTTTLTFPEAGHALSGSGWDPLGSDGRWDSQAQRQVWPALLKFLQNNLLQSTGPHAEMARKANRGGSSR